MPSFIDMYMYVCVLNLKIVILNLETLKNCQSSKLYLSFPLHSTYMYTVRVYTWQERREEGRGKREEGKREKERGEKRGD